MKISYSLCSRLVAESVNGSIIRSTSSSGPGDEHRQVGGFRQIEAFFVNVCTALRTVSEETAETFPVMSPVRTDYDVFTRRGK